MGKPIYRQDARYPEGLSVLLLHAGCLGQSRVLSEHARWKPSKTTARLSAQRKVRDKRVIRTLFHRTGNDGRDLPHVGLLLGCRAPKWISSGFGRPDRRTV